MVPADTADWAYLTPSAFASCGFPEIPNESARAESAVITFFPTQILSVAITSGMPFSREESTSDSVFLFIVI